MSERTAGLALAPLSLPDDPNLDWLRKQAKRRLEELRALAPATRLAAAQFEIAKRYGFPSWRALKAHVDSLTLDGQLIAAAGGGDAATLAALLDRHPEKLHLRSQPYRWTLLHHAAAPGHVDAVDLLLRRGLDVDSRDTGDNAYALHFAAGAGHTEVVRRLVEAGGDVIGAGDDHELEVLGWATCFEPCHDDVADFLLRNGARHHIYSAIAMNLADEVKRIVAADSSALERRQSRNEDRRLPLHFAVLKNRPQMVALLIELGADPAATDGSGFPAVAYATSPTVDGKVLEAIRARGGSDDLFTALALREWDAAERLIGAARSSPLPGGAGSGALSLMSKRGDPEAVRWLLAHGADPNGRWWHWDAEVTPLHMASAYGHTDVVRLLLDAGADPSLRDSKHEGDARGWASHFRQPEIVRILDRHAAG